MDSTGVGYGYEKQFRDHNPPNLDNGILKATGNFETIDKRKVLGIIDIQVDDRLISGSGNFIEYVSMGMGENSRRIAMGGKSTYLGVGIGKVGGSDFEGIILDSNNYEEKLAKLKSHTKGREIEMAR